MEILGTNGNDSITGTNLTEKIRGLAGRDTIYGEGGDDTIFGNGDDSYSGPRYERDDLWGGDGNDVIRIHAGRGLGNDGDDFLFCENYFSVARGGNGNDVIRDVGNTRSELRGEGGNDTIFGGTSGNKISGGGGNDVR